MISRAKSKPVARKAAKTQKKSLKLDRDLKKGLAFLCDSARKLILPRFSLETLRSKTLQ
jgi:hypothetical protein